MIGGYTKNEWITLVPPKSMGAYYYLETAFPNILDQVNEICGVKRYNGDLVFKNGYAFKIGINNTIYQNFANEIMENYNKLEITESILKELE